MSWDGTARAGAGALMFAQHLRMLSVVATYIRSQRAMSLTLSHASQNVLSHLAVGQHDCVRSATQAGRQVGIATAIGAQWVNVAAHFEQVWLGRLGWVVSIAAIDALAHHNYPYCTISASG